MAMFLYVFAQSETAVAADDVEEIAGEAWYGDGVPQFERNSPAGDLLRIRLPGTDKPITVNVDSDPSAVGTMVEEQLGEHDDVPPDAADKLRGARQVVSFEVFPETLDDDGWELLDVLESSLARELDGLIVTDDGIYDVELKKLTP